MRSDDVEDDPSGLGRMSGISGLSMPSDDADADDIRESVMSSLSSHSLDRPHKRSHSQGSEEAFLQQPHSSSGSDFTMPAALAAFNLIFGCSAIDSAVKVMRGDDLSPGPIHVHAVNKGMMPRHFQKTRLAQVIQAHDGAIYTMKFSVDGKYLATGGEDARVLVWIVGQLPTPTEESLDSPAPSVASEGNDASQPQAGAAQRSQQQAKSGGGAALSVGSGSGKDELAESASIASISNSEDRSVSSSDRDDLEANASIPDKVDRNIIIFPTPFREYIGHTESVLDVAWSGSNFLLSASADKFVRLWRLEENGRCLKLFGHTDIVTSVDFHPSNDTHFVSACFNGQIRLWDNIRSNTLDYAVAPLDENNCNVAFTSVSFVPDGSRVFAGLKDGQILIYAYRVESADKVKITRETSLGHLRDRKGKYSNGRKVTGICFDTSKGTDHKLLRWCVTSNDSNIRLVESIDPPYKYACKYKGGKNTSLQIKASFSEGGSFLICPAENGTILIWEPEDDSTNLGCESIFSIKRPETRRNSTYEWFYATDTPQEGKGKAARTPATAAVFAPAGSVNRLLESALEIQRRSSYFKKLSDAGTPISQTLYSGATRKEPPSASRDGGPSYSIRSNFSSTSFGGTFPDDAQLSTLIIATADGEGKIRVFVRSL